jgi:UDP-3-O-[3-hydroxymyristoyl] glucosamine N-acyltransferase
MNAKEIFDFLNASNIYGDENTKISKLSSITNIEDNSLVCIDEKRFLEKALNSSASCLILKEKPEDTNNKTIIITENPKEDFYKLLEYFYPQKEIEYGTIKNSAKIDSSAEISKTAFIDEYVVIGKNSKIGDNTIINAGVVIGDNILIGDNCRIFSNTSIHDGTIIKNNVIIGSNCVLGTDGFGYRLINGRHIKIPQKGNVVIESNCELGASVMIDRAILGSTKIGEGSKIDNLVHIAHNCEIGENTIIIAQVGVAGSSKIGNYCVIAGQAGIADHVEIGNQVIIAAQAGIMSNAKIEDNKILFGSPAQDISREKLCIIAYRKLPELLKLIEDKFDVRIKAPKS